MEELKYKRIVLKISGESLAHNEKYEKKVKILSDYLAPLIALSKVPKEVLEAIKDVVKQSNFGINYEYVKEICETIKYCNDSGAQIIIISGGGNFWRGRSNDQMDKVSSDHIGMLGTNMNSLTIEAAINELYGDVDHARVQTKIAMDAIAEVYIKKRAVKHLEKNRITIIGCGTGNPGYSTDTAAAQYAMELHADAIIKLTLVDGVYDKNPELEGARLLETLSFNDVSDDHKVMDATAFDLCKENDIPIIVTNISKIQDELPKILAGENLGTLIASNVETKYKEPAKSLSFNK